MMFTSYPDLVDITQLKEMLGIGITLAYRLVRNNTIQALKVGRQYKIPKRNIISYLTNQNQIWLEFNLLSWYFTISISMLILVVIQRKEYLWI